MTGSEKNLWILTFSSAFIDNLKRAIGWDSHYEPIEPVEPLNAFCDAVQVAGKTIELARDGMTEKRLGVDNVYYKLLLEALEE